MKNFRTRLTKQQFDNYKVSYPSNMVIVEIPHYEEVKTPAGINVGFNPDVLYSDYDGEDTSARPADLAGVRGVIVKQVDQLYFNPKNISRSMSWDAIVETEIGMTVWTHPLNVKNCCEIEVDDKLYQVWPYEDLFVGRVNDRVVCLNGSVILEPLYKERSSELDVLESEIDKTKAIVRFNGSDNKCYLNKGFTDMKGLKDGDVVLIDRNTYLFYLERFSYNATFDNGKKYWCIQKKHIIGIL